MISKYITSFAMLILCFSAVLGNAGGGFEGVVIVTGDTIQVRSGQTGTGPARTLDVSHFSRDSLRFLRIMKGHHATFAVKGARIESVSFDPLNYNQNKVTVYRDGVSIEGSVRGLGSGNNRGKWGFRIGEDIVKDLLLLFGPMDDTGTFNRFYRDIMGPASTKEEAAELFAMGRDRYRVRAFWDQDGRALNPVHVQPIYPGSEASPRDEWDKTHSLAAGQLQYNDDYEFHLTAPNGEVILVDSRHDGTAVGQANHERTIESLKRHVGCEVVLQVLGHRASKVYYVIPDGIVTPEDVLELVPVPSGADCVPRVGSKPPGKAK